MKLLFIIKRRNSSNNYCWVALLSSVKVYQLDLHFFLSLLNDFNVYCLPVHRSPQYELGDGVPALRQPYWLLGE